MRILKTLLLFIILWFGFFLLSYGQEAYSNKDLSIKELKEDLNIFRSCLEEAHPGLYWFNSKSGMDQIFDNALASLKSPMTEKDFFPILNRITTKIGCLHTSIMPSAALVEDFVPDDSPYFPLKMKFLSEGAFIHQNLSENPNIDLGNEVMAINDLAIDAIVPNLIQYLSNDGYGKGWASYTLEKVFHVYYRFFLDESKQFRILIKDQNGIRKEFTVAGLSVEKMDSIKHIRYGNTSRQEPFIQLRFIKEANAGMLRIPRFENWKIGNKKFNFKQVLKESMKSIVDSGVENLILDVGDRGGGNEQYGLELLSYFIDKPFKGYKAIEFSTTKFKSRKYSNTSWLEYAFFKSIMRFRKSDSTFLLMNNKSLKPVKPSPIHFSGNVYLLISRTTASATSDFAAWVHDLDIATVVGEETGGGYLGNTSNWEFNITLPNTNIRLHMPLSRYLTNVKEDMPFGGGVVPDHLVLPTIEHILDGVDPQLGYVLELIDKSE